jgi:hypothetical protein
MLSGVEDRSLVRITKGAELEECVEASRCYAMHRSTAKGGRFHTNGRSLCRDAMIVFSIRLFHPLPYLARQD